jgi:predicted negative regulator of RcsB-dependent stress response
VDEYMTESEQWEEFKRWLRENWMWMLGGVVLGVVALAGWRLWQERAERLAVEASARYEQALEALVRDDRTRALTLFDELRRDHDTSPYADQGDLTAARLHVEAREYDKAVERLARVATTSSDAELQLVARGRLARVYLEQGKPDAALAEVDPQQAGEFAARFEEIRGDALLAKGDRAGALAAYRAARDSAGEGVIDRGLLDLKIASLEPVPTGDAPAAAAPADADPAGTN